MKRSHKLLALLSLAALGSTPALASTSYGSLNNFDVVNDTGQDTHGFEIELEDVHSVDITYTFDWNHYGTPRITEDNSNPLHPRVSIRYEAKFDPVAGTFSAYTAMPTAPIAPTDGHMCTDPSVNFGCEHFGVGFSAAPSLVLYHWLIDDPAAPGNLIQGPVVNVATPTFTYYPPAPQQPLPQVQAVIAAPPPPPAPVYEFGDASWVKEIRTTTHNNARVELADLVSDDPDDPNDRNWANGEPAEVEVEWQIMQTEFNNPAGANNELAGAKEGLPGGDEVVTRRYEFYKYTGPFDPETHEALCDNYPQITDPADPTYKAECAPPVEIMGDYIGAQMAGFNVEALLGLIDHVEDGAINEPVTARRIVVGGNTPYTTELTAGSLPDGVSIDPATGVLDGTPTVSGDFPFTVHVTDADGVQVSKAYTMKVIDPSAVPAQFQLSVSRTGNGSGTVSGSGIDCGATCSVALDAGTAVSLTAVANPGSVFTGWGGACAGLAGCALTLDADAVVTARFSPPDTMPNAFSFADVIDVPSGGVRGSAQRTIAGINTDVQVSLGAGSDGSARVLIDGIDVTASLPVLVHAGQKVRLKLTAAQAGGTTVSAVLKVGKFTTTWNVTTIVDAMPTAFSFGNLPASKPGAVRLSTLRTIAGINVDVPVTLEPGTDPSAQVLIDGAVVALPYAAHAGQQIQLRMTAGPTTQTVSAVLKVGGYSTTWSITSR